MYLRPARRVDHLIDVWEPLPTNAPGPLAQPLLLLRQHDHILCQALRAVRAARSLALARRHRPHERAASGNTTGSTIACDGMTSSDMAATAS